MKNNIITGKAKNRKVCLKPIEYTINPEIEGTITAINIIIA